MWVMQLVEALCCKSEGRGFDFWWEHPSGKIMALVSNECQEYLLGPIVYKFSEPQSPAPLGACPEP